MGLINQVAQAMDDSVTQEVRKQYTPLPSSTNTFIPYPQPFSLVFFPPFYYLFLDHLSTPPSPLGCPQVTNHLFEEPKRRWGMDLAAINMQRGREHGVNSYNAYRDLCGLPRVRYFEDLLGTMSNSTVNRYKLIYRYVWEGEVREVRVIVDLLFLLFPFLSLVVVVFLVYVCLFVYCDYLFNSFLGYYFHPSWLNIHPPFFLSLYLLPSLPYLTFLSLPYLYLPTHLIFSPCILLLTSSSLIDTLTILISGAVEWASVPFLAPWSDLPSAALLDSPSRKCVSVTGSGTKTKASPPNLPQVSVLVCIRDGL